MTLSEFGAPGLTLGAWLPAAVLLAALVLAAWRPAAVVARPRSVLALTALASLVAAFVLIRIDPPGLAIDVDPSSGPLIRRSEPGLPLYEQAIREFGSDDGIVVAMGVDDVFTAANLETIHELTHRLRALPGVQDVESLARVLSLRFDAERNAIAIGRLMNDPPVDPQEIESLRARALADPIYRKTLLSADARTTALNIRFEPMEDALFHSLQLDARIAAIVDDLRRPGQEFFVAGRPHTRAVVHVTMVRDLLTFVPLAILVALVLLWWMRGSMRAVFVPLVSCLIATLWVLAVMVSLGVDINLITLVLPPMLICIGAVYGVHVFVRYDDLALAGGHPSEIALQCIRAVRLPVLAAGFTTCIGFAALWVADIPATAELGSFACLGVLAVTLLSLTAVPAALILWPETERQPATLAAGERPRHSHVRFTRWLDSLLEAVARVAVQRRKPVLAATVGVGIACMMLIPRIEIDTDMIAFFHDDAPIRRDFDAVRERLSGAVPIYVVISGAEEGGFREPAVMAALADLQEGIEGLPGVGAVLSAADLLRLFERARDEGEREGRLPETRAALAEAMFFIPRDALGSFVAANHARANLIVRTGEAGSSATAALEEGIGALLVGGSLPSGLRGDVVGKELIVNRSAHAIASNQPLQVGLAATAVFALVCVAFRSLRMGLVSMVPNVVPVLCFFGALGAGAAPLSLPTSLIGSIALGIAIDDTMHFLAAYRRYRSESAADGALCSPERAAHEAIRQVGRPIVMTSVMLVVGFLVIVVSGFATLQQFGALTALTMALCLVTDLLVLPALLVSVRA